jgi:hypothetical protein
LKVGTAAGAAGSESWLSASSRADTTTLKMQSSGDALRHPPGNGEAVHRPLRGDGRPAAEDSRVAVRSSKASKEPREAVSLIRPTSAVGEIADTCSGALRTPWRRVAPALRGKRAGAAAWTRTTYKGCSRRDARIAGRRPAPRTARWTYLDCTVDRPNQPTRIARGSSRAAWMGPRQRGDASNSDHHPSPASPKSRAASGHDGKRGCLCNAAPFAAI